MKKRDHFGCKSEVVIECNLEQGDILMFVKSASQKFQHNLDNKVVKWETFTKTYLQNVITAWSIADSEGLDPRKYV